MPKLERKTKHPRNSVAASLLIATCFFFICAFLIEPAPKAYGASVQSLQQRARAASARVSEMEGTLSTAMDALNKATAELRETEDSIAENEEAAEQLEQSIAVNREALERQANFIYRSNRLGYLEMIFAAQSLAEFSSALNMVDFMAQHDAQTIEDLRVQTAQLERTLAELNELREQQEYIAANKRAEADAAQRLLNEQQNYVNSLNSQVQEALQREQDRQNREAATRAAAPSGSNRASGESAASGSGGYVATGMTFTGIASWYQVGTRTANGERFNPDAMTAAHKTLPFGTLVRVTFRGNSVVVRINDRGPFTGGRIIDLSRGSAEVIGLKSAGVGTVTVEVVQRP